MMYVYYSIDATKDNGRMGRLVNHSTKTPNVVTKVIPINNHPYLCLIAKRCLQEGEELLYDYGERQNNHCITSLVNQLIN